MIMRINGIANRFIGDGRNGSDQALGQGFIDLGIDDGNGVVTDDHSAIDDISKDIDSVRNPL